MTAIGDREATVKVRLIQTGGRKIRGQGRHHPSPGGHVSVLIRSGRLGHHCRGSLESQVKFNLNY